MTDLLVIFDWGILRFILDTTNSWNSSLQFLHFLSSSVYLSNAFSKIWYCRRKTELYLSLRQITKGCIWMLDLQIFCPCFIKIIWCEFYMLCWQMDRASILGDAIEYLKELLQRINDLHNELESTPASSSMTPTTSFHPLTPTPSALPSPTPSALPSRIMDKLCPSSLPSPNGQPARVIFSICDFLNVFMCLRWSPRFFLALFSTAMTFSFCLPYFLLPWHSVSASKIFKE